MPGRVFEMEGHSPDETKLLISWGVQTGGCPLSLPAIRCCMGETGVRGIQRSTSVHLYMPEDFETIQADYSRMQSTCQICTSAATNASNWHRL